MTDKANFLLASSGLIALLAVTCLVELRWFDAPAGSKALWRRIARLYGVLTVVGATALGEVICLRGLELGHVSRGQLRWIWCVLAILGFHNILALAISALFGRDGRVA